MLLGGLLSPYSLWGALQYALEALWRVRRMRNPHEVPVWSLGSTCPLSWRPVPAAVWRELAQASAQAASPISRARRWFLRGFGVFLLVLGCYLGFGVLDAYTTPWGMVAVALALLLGSSLMLYKPEVFSS